MSVDKNGALERLEKYIREYRDAPSWGGPTRYPEAPSILDLSELIQMVRNPLPKGELAAIAEKVGQKVYDAAWERQYYNGVNRENRDEFKHSMHPSIDKECERMRAVAMHAVRGELESRR